MNKKKCGTIPIDHGNDKSDINGDGSADGSSGVNVDSIGGGGGGGGGGIRITNNDDKNNYDEKYDNDDDDDDLDWILEESASGWISENEMNLKKVKEINDDDDNVEKTKEPDEGKSKRSEEESLEFEELKKLQQNLQKSILNTLSQISPSIKIMEEEKKLEKDISSSYQYVLNRLKPHLQNETEHEEDSMNEKIQNKSRNTSKNDMTMMTTMGSSSHAWDQSQQSQESNFVEWLRENKNVMEWESKSLLKPSSYTKLDDLEQIIQQRELEIVRKIVQYSSPDLTQKLFDNK